MKKKILIKSYPDGLVEIYADPEEVYVKIMEVPSGIRGKGMDAYIPFKNIKFHKTRIRLVASRQLDHKPPKKKSVRKKYRNVKCQECSTGWKSVLEDDVVTDMVRCCACSGTGIKKEWWD